MIALLTLCAAPVHADGYKSMARELASAARRSRIERVAVLPFEPADDSVRAAGWGVSEHFVTQLVRSGKVQAVERTMLRKLFEEHRLSETGALEASTVKKLGRVLAADGIVTGSFVTLGSEVRVSARLIDVESGVIVAACEKTVDREWFDGDKAIFVPAPEFIAEVPRMEAEADPCSGASETVDGLERQVLDLKARYWALKLRQGLDPRSLKANPGSTISDPELRRAFYERLKTWHQEPAIPELSPVEVRRLVSIDGRAYSLSQQCGI